MLTNHNNKKPELNTTKEINLKDFEPQSFQLAPDEPELPFAQIPNELLRDTSLSPACIWLISYLLSHKTGWIIKMSQIINHLKGRMGKMAIYKIRKEAIEAGYLYCHEFIENNLKRYCYFISRTPRFKKSFRCPENRYTEKNDSKERTLEKKTKEEKEESMQVLSDAKVSTQDPFKKDSIPSVKEKKKDSPKEEPKPIVIDSPEMMEIYELEPKLLSYFSGHQIKIWLKKFGDHLVLKTLKYFLSQNLKKIRNAAAWMEKAFKEKYAWVNETVFNNKGLAKEFGERNSLKKMKINSRYLVNMDNGKELYFSFPQDTFYERLLEIFKPEE